MIRSLRVLNWKAEGVGTGADAAITQQRIGQGHVVFITTSANEEWITFTRKPVYTELVNELLSGSVDVGDGWMNLTVGESLLVPSSLKLSTTPALVDPKSLPIPLELKTGVDGAATYGSLPLSQPGVYTLNTGAGSLPIAVNVPPEEADVHTIDQPVIKAAWGGST